ncbi:MAG: hypothetical protein IV100_13030, partial [Myxococcales bacterium]|nr:hypothetical protein [Myxococcales bacterium]
MDTTTIESESDAAPVESESSVSEKKPAVKKSADSVESESDRASEAKVEHEYAEVVPKVEAPPTSHKKRSSKKGKKSKKSKEEPEASVSVKSSDAPKEEPAA